MSVAARKLASEEPLTYGDLAELFQLSVDKVKRRMPEWKARGFPQELPWRRRDKLWNAAAVLSWKAREERRAGAYGPPDLKIVYSDRPPA